MYLKLTLKGFRGLCVRGMGVGMCKHAWMHTCTHMRERERMKKVVSTIKVNI